MKYRETATEIKIQNRIHGYFAPSIFFYGKYADAKKHVENISTLINRFPNHWICY